MTCFFIGHRDSPESLRPLLETAVLKHIVEHEITEFTVGRYGSFDRMAASAVMASKRQHPQVRLLLLLPYHPSDRPIQTPEGFDGTFYPPGMETVPKRLCISRANRYMVDHSDYLIAYARYPASNAWTLVEYAKAREKAGTMRVLNLAEHI